MVKRQTVWLSTMMVLSLMLIGYYTMNNNGAQTTGTGTGQGSDTAVISPSVSSDTTGQSTGNGQTPTGAGTSSDDFFVIQQTNASTSIAKQEQTYLDVLANNGSTSTQIDQAEQQLQKLQGLQGSMQSVEATIKSEGYSDCALVPNADGSLMTVYVKAKSLSALSAAKLMNLVSQQLSIPIDNVIVHQH